MGVGKVGELYVEIGADNKPLKTSLRDSEKAVQQVQKDMQSNLTATADKIGKVGTGLTLGITAPYIAGSMAAIKYASDLYETTSKVDVVFDKNADAVKAWANTSIEQMGLARESAMSAASTYGNMADGMGLASDTGLEMAMSLTQLSADLASFNNTSQETARIALNSVFTGETETLKQYGIVMTQTNLQQYAMSRGITKNIQSMTQAEQVQLRYNYVLANTANAQGDFARTSDSVANQTRMAQEQLKEAAATLGENLLPMATKALSGVNGLLKGFNSLDKDTQKLILTIGGVAAAAGPVLKIGSSAYKGMLKIREAGKAMQVSKIAKEITQFGTSSTAASKGLDLLTNGMKKADGALYTTKEVLEHNTAEFAKMGVSSEQAAKALAATAATSKTAQAGLEGTGSAAVAAQPGIKSFGVTLNSALGIVGLVIGGVTTLIGVFSELSKPSEEAQALKENTDSLIESLNKSASEFENSTAKIDQQTSMANGLAKEINALNSEILAMNASDGASAGQKELLKQKADKLNSVLGKTVITINEQTGAINENIDSVYDSIDAYTKQAKTQAFLERYNELLKNNNDLEIDKGIAIQKINAGFGELNKTTQEYIRRAYETGGAQKALTEIINLGGNDMRTYANMIVASDEALNSATGDMEAFKAMAAEAGIDINSLIVATEGETEATEKLSVATKQLTEDEALLLMRRIENGDKLNDSDAANLELWKSNNEERAKILEESVKRETELQNARVEAATDANDRIKLSDQTSLKEAAKNIEENTKVVEQYTADLDYLYGKIPDTVHTYLEEAGADQARIVSEMRKNMETGGGEIAQRFVDAYLAALQAGKSPAEAEAIALGDTTDAGVGKGLDNGQAATNAAEAEIKDIKGTMQSAIGVAGFETDGMNIASAIARGLSRARSQIYDVVDQITDTIKAKFSINVTATATGSGASVKAYDVGGYFTKPQFIQIAEKRPEFVGAADDLESFVSKAVNNAFVGVNPAVLQAVPLPQVTNNQSGDTINFNPQITFYAQKITDAEMKRATQYIKREFAKATGGHMS